ncbi:helix-turn-helix transcriptional regulator [Actinokineospora globicatena]
MGRIQPRRVGLVAARKWAGFTQERFAEAAGVDRSTVGRWESGSRSPLIYKHPLLADCSRSRWSGWANY